jgi:N-methylhydantoinase A
MITVGIDVGGTFTDLVAVDSNNGEVKTAKFPSRPDRPSEAILAGIRELGVAEASIERLIHGTTIATNALIERRGAVTAIVTTTGCRDVVEIGRGRRLVEGGMFDIRFRRPEPLVPRHRRIEVEERLRASGDVLRPLRAEDLQAAIARLAEEGAESVAVCFLHSYRNNAHERAAAEAIAKALGDRVYVTMSSVVNPQHREFERFSTTAVNAYVGPKVKEYLGQLARDTHGVSADGAMYVMSSAGGIMDFRTAAMFPVNTILSGPAGGVIASALVARELGLADVITCDMGGTSTDVALLKDSAASYASETIVSGVPIRASQLDINTIGAGAGSIVWLDADGALAVGPKSAGAFPGPACYGNGGSEATITDANVLLGRIADGTRLGGRIPVRGELAAEAFAALEREGAFRNAVDAAQGALDVLIAKTARAIAEISLERGFDPRDFALVAFGGAGPMHAAEVADTLGIKTVVVPNHAGIFSAVGLARADIRRDAVTTCVSAVAALDCTELQRKLESMREGLVAEIQATRAHLLAVRTTYELEMRCSGQTHELQVSLGSDLAALSRDLIESTFQSTYERRYGRPPARPSEIVQARVLVEAKVDTTSAATWCSAKAANVPPGNRLVCFKGQRVRTSIRARQSLAHGDRIDGPAVIEEQGATTVVPSGWQAELHGSGHLVLSASPARRSRATDSASVESAA